MSSSHALLSTPIMAGSGPGTQPSSTNVVASTSGSAKHRIRASMHVMPKDLVAAWPLGPRSPAPTRLPRSTCRTLVQIIILHPARLALGSTARAVVIHQLRQTSMGLHPTRRRASRADSMSL